MEREIHCWIIVLVVSTRSVCHGSAKPSDFSNSNYIWDIKHVNSVFHLFDTMWFEARFFSLTDSILMKSFRMAQLFRKQFNISFTPTLLFRKCFATQKLDVKSFGICARMPLVNAEAGQWSQITTFCCKPNCKTNANTLYRTEPINFLLSLCSSQP